MHNDDGHHLSRSQQQNWNVASDMSYYTPPPSGNWNGTMPFAQSHGANGQAHHHNSQFPQHQQSQQNMPNPMLMMMTMMSQMQNVPPAPRPQHQTPVTETQKPFVPMDAHKLAQVLFQQTASGVSYKSAIETMHGVCNHILCHKMPISE